MSGPRDAALEALKILSKAANLRGFLETQAPVCRPADLIFEQGVRGKLRASTFLGPTLGRPYQGPTHALPPSLGRDIPAFEVRNPVRYTILGIGADRQFRESDRAAALVHREQHLERLAQ